ncbi:MAG TPA: alpha/beta hydrolase, partial [Ktedonobacterales bacterium]|nr:alpha/beta hydrolase [Ktedonobacterales bacterium]
MSESTPSGTTAARTERTISARGVETHLFEAGPPDAPPLLYLHGTFLGNLWLDYHQALARDFHLFAPDIPGFGLTPRPAWMNDITDYVLYYRDLLDALELEHPAIVGHSLGGWMAVEIAVWYPGRIGKLVLSDAAGIWVKGSPIADLFAMAPRETVMISFEDLTAATPLIPTDLGIDYYARLYREATTLAALAWNPSYDPKLERRLERITNPTLVIWGAKDRLIPPVYGEKFQQMIPGAQLVMIEGTGHMPMFEKVEEWSGAITRFLH